jgi:hypothetical protein
MVAQSRRLPQKWPVHAAYLAPWKHPRTKINADTLHLPFSSARIGQKPTNPDDRRIARDGLPFRKNKSRQQLAHSVFTEYSELCSKPCRPQTVQSRSVVCVACSLCVGSGIRLRAPLARAFVAGTLVGIGRACLGRPSQRRGTCVLRLGDLAYVFFLKWNTV